MGEELDAAAVAVDQGLHDDVSRTYAPATTIPAPGAVARVPGAATGDWWQDRGALCKSCDVEPAIDLHSVSLPGWRCISYSIPYARSLHGEPLSRLRQLLLYVYPYAGLHEAGPVSTYEVGAAHADLLGHGKCGSDDWPVPAHL